MADYNNFNFSAYGGAGFGLKDLEYLKSQGASYSQIGQIAQQAASKGLNISREVRDYAANSRPPGPMETWTSPINNTLQKPEGEGWSITGYSEVRRAANPNRMGSGFTTVQVPIYTRQGPQEASWAGGIPANPTPVQVTPEPEVVTTPYSEEITQLEKSLSDGASSDLPSSASPSNVSQDSTFDYEGMIRDMQINTSNMVQQMMTPIMEQLAATQNNQRMMAEAQRTANINQARSQAAGNLQIQSAERDTGVGGTSAFKRRSVMPNSLSILSNTLNI